MHDLQISRKRFKFLYLLIRRLIKIFSHNLANPSTSATEIPYYMLHSGDENKRIRMRIIVFKMFTSTNQVSFNGLQVNGG